MISAAWAHAFGWALLHSLWEGAAIALVLAVLLRVLQSSQARYTAACLALLAMVAVFSATVAQERPRQTAAFSVRTYHSVIQNEPSPSFPRHFPKSDLPQYLALIWMTGVALFHLRTLVSWLAAQRLRRRGVCLAPEIWQQRFVELRRKLRLPQSVALFESCFARVPVVVGFLRPVVLVPLGMLASMPASQVETILLHELAHIQRRDALVNLLQAVAENFLFFHPAVWWISGVIRREREHCCDDLVVAVCGSAGEYAHALTTLERNRWTASHVVLAANGGNLMRRITRMLYPQEAKQQSVAPVVLAGVLTLFAAMALNAWQTQPAEPENAVYKKWLKEDVAYIIQAEELASFLQLATDPEREHFVEQFWERRDPTPGTALNEFKVEYYRRIAYANNHYSSVSGIAGWKTDRGTEFYILFGPPDEIESHPDASSAIGAPYENWLYYKITGIGEQVMIQFVDNNSNGEYKMTRDPHAAKQEPR